MRYASVCFAFALIVGIASRSEAVDPRCAGGELPPTQTVLLDASVVFVRENCCTLPEAVQAYCFDDRVGSNVIDQLDLWLGMYSGSSPSSRHPSAASPVTVDIGEGEFSGTITCVDSSSTPTGVFGFTSFRGAGRTKTVLHPTNGNIGIQAHGCDQLAFSDMKFAPTSPGSADVGLLGTRSNTSWTNVDVLGWWYEEAGCQVEVAHDPNGLPIFYPTQHIWSNSTFLAKHSSLIFGSPRNPPPIPDPGRLEDQGIGYFSECDITRFYGGKISLHIPEPVDPTRAAYAAVAAAGTGVFEGYGTEIEVVADASRPNPVNAGLEEGAAGAVALVADLWTGLTTGPNSLLIDAGGGPSGGKIELYGGAVHVDVAAIPNQSASAAFSSRYGTIETTGTEFSVTAATGQPAHRVAGTGRFHSPHFRQTEACAPFAQTSDPGPLTSLTGQDAFLEGGCDAGGTCGGAGTQKHLMIYDTTCSAANPWRDQTTGACRVLNPAASSADDDLDGVVNVSDNCVCSANPPITPLAFQHTTGGQLDDDQDGFGNQCDGDFDNNGAVDGTDYLEFTASMGKLRSASNCGTQSSTQCARFDLDNTANAISSVDLNKFRALGPEPGAKCASCPLP